MRNFIKMLPYKKALAVYLLVFLLLTAIGKTFGYEWYGFKFSLPIVLGSMMVDLLFTYFILYKKWPKN